MKHFQEHQNDSLFEEIVNRLQIEVPEFIPVYDFDDGAYPVFADFGRYLIVLNKKKEKEILIKCFGFLEKILKDQNPKVEDLIVLQVFSEIFNDENLTAFARATLKENALSLFNDSYNYKDEMY